MAGLPFDPTSITSAAPPTSPFAPPSPEVVAEAPKGTKLTKDDALTIKRRLKMSEKFKTNMFAKDYMRCKKLYRGEHYDDLDKPSETPRIVVNYILPNIETKAAALGFNFPDFIINGRNPQSDQQSEIARAAISFEWKLADAQREAKRALKDMLMFSFGVVQCGWMFKTADVSLQDERLPVEGEMPDPATTMQQVITGAPLPNAVPQADVLEDRFFVRRLDPVCFLPDPEGTWVVQDHRYVGYVEVVPVKEVKAEKRYENTRTLKGTADNLTAYFTDDLRKIEDSPDGDLPNDVLRCKLYHYYEKKRRIHVVMCDEHDKPLLIEDWHPRQTCYPFEALHCGYGDESSFYQLPGPRLLESMQLEINAIRSKLHTALKRINRGFLVPKGWLDPQAKKHLRSGEEGAVIEHSGNDANAIVPLQLGQFPPEVFQADEWAKGDMQSVSAVNQYDAGNPTGGRKTAHEVEAIQRGGGARMASDAQNFEMFCGRIATQCLWWLQKFSTKTRMLPIQDQYSDVKQWQPFTGGMIEGDFAIDVYVGSTQVKNNPDRVEELGFLLQSLGPFMQMPDPVTGMPMINVRPLLFQLLKAIPDIKDVQSIIAPVQPPMIPGMPPGAEGLPPEGGQDAGALQNGGDAMQDPVALLAAMRAGIGGPQGGA